VKRQARFASGSNLPTIVVTGFMGTGKTSVACELSSMLGLEFLDTDTEIERSEGRTIAEIFARHGEDHFRSMERRLCASLKGRRGVVIATGGGTLLDAGVREMFGDGAHIVLLETSLETLCTRLESNRNRPLLATDGQPLSTSALRERVAAMLGERRPAYHRITNRVDTSQGTPVDAASRIAASTRLPHETLFILPGGSAPKKDAEAVPAGRYGASRIEIGRGALSKLGIRLREMGLTTHAFLLMSEVIQRLFLPQIARSLDDADVPFSVIDVEDGDSRKNLGQTERIIDHLIEHGARRDATVIPVGGGVTGDIGGLAASLFMRGVPLVQVPTTLLAQVDSSIGGKVGVNHPLAKNLIGAFYQPHLVLSDPCTLRSLPIEEVSNGMAEVVKSALIGSEAFFDFLDQSMSGDAAALRDVGFLETCVVESGRIKVEIVNADPYENDRRRTINLGHTVGHALEASAGYQGLKHGQAVSLGLLAALRIAVSRGALSAEVLDRTRSILARCGLPVTLESFDRPSVVRSLRLDKKIRNGRIHFVMPTGIGRTRVVDDVGVEEILAAMEIDRA
jgi:3-dehydroquinate synthase